MTIRFAASWQIFFLLSVLPASFAADASPNAQVEDLLAEAARLRSFNQLDAAIQKYETARRLKPDDPTLLRNLGVLYFETRRYDKAVQFLKASQPSHESDPYTHFYLAECYMATAQPGPAESEYREALKLNPEFSEARYGLGFLLENKGDIRGAEEHYRAAISKNPNHAGAFFQLGMMAYQKGDLRTAQRMFEQVVLLDPNKMPAHYNLGLIYRDLGNFEKAREEFKRAITLDPANAAAFFQAAVTYEQRGFLREAAMGYEEALKLNPNFGEAKGNLMAIRRQLRNEEDSEAPKEYQHAIPIFSGTFGRGGFRANSPLDAFGGFGNSAGAEGGAKLNSKALLFQLGTQLLQQWLNARQRSSSESENSSGNY